MLHKIVDAIMGFIILVFIILGVILSVRFLYIQITKTSSIPENQEIQLTENTKVFTVNLDGIVCGIAESKTNGYVDVEIDCK